MRIVLVVGLASLALFAPFGVANSTDGGADNDGSALGESALSAGTVTIMSGSTFDGTADIARDLAALVGPGVEPGVGPGTESGTALRAVPMIGQGPAQTLRDVLTLGSVDMGVTHSTVLSHYVRTGELGPIKERLVYVAKLFNEDLHLLTSADVGNIEDLNGKTVNVGPKASGTEIAAGVLFDALRLDIEATHLQTADAVAKLKDGAIDATLLIGPTPIAGLSRLGPDSGLKLLAVPYPEDMEAETYPTVLTHDDYPNLIAPGARLDTVGICAVLVALKDKPDTARHAKIERFVGQFFSRFDTLLEAPNHPKWRDVNFAAILEEWPRAPQAQAWIDTARATALAEVQERENFKSFLRQAGDTVSTESVSEADQEKLFRAFKAWSKAQQPN